MSNIKMIRSVLKEYGTAWAVNRILYSGKLKLLGRAASADVFFEKKTSYPQRIDVFNINVDGLRKFLQHELSVDDKEHLIATADKACEGKILGFSSLTLDYGNPIDWQLNPLTGKRCNEHLKWYQIPDFDKARGDIKVIWEASRFSHFITLARAYLLADDVKYYEAFSSQLKSWLEQNPYPFGANFKCGQECSLRMVNILLSYTIFKACKVTTDADGSNVMDLVDRCYRKILSNFFYAYKCIKNNHTLSELMGMIVGAWCCGDHKQLTYAYKTLDEVIDEQFDSVGGYRQYSFNYQRLALQDLEVVLSIEDTTGKTLSSRSKEKIKKAAMLMYQCQDESGDMPNYGSNDGALVFPVTSCGYRDFRPAINTAYALVSGKQLYSTSTGAGTNLCTYQEELLWFSGGKGIGEYKLTEIPRASSQYRPAGLFTVRSKRGARSWVMIIANDYHSRPAHMDQLHIDLWVKGVNVLCDGGTYSYASVEGRKLALNTEHNTSVVKNTSGTAVPQMNMRPPFMVYDWTDRKLGKSGTHIFEGLIISKNGYKHRRRVKADNGVYVILDKVEVAGSGSDVISAGGGKYFEILFHTPCNVRIEGASAVLLWNGYVLCRISADNKDHNITMTMHPSVRSLYYLKKEDTTCVAIRGMVGQEIKTRIDIV